MKNKANLGFVKFVLLNDSDFKNTDEDFTFKKK